VEQLGLVLSDEQIKDVTSKIKELADVRGEYGRVTHPWQY
jgi:hypothetical protein